MWSLECSQKMLRNDGRAVALQYPLRNFVGEGIIIGYIYMLTVKTYFQQTQIVSIARTILKSHNLIVSPIESSISLEPLMQV